MAEMKSLNGNTFVDQSARDEIEALKKNGVGGGGGDVTTSAMQAAIAAAIQEHDEKIQVHPNRLDPMANELLAIKQTVSAIPKFKIEVVTVHPTITEASTTTVYLVPSGGADGNLYTEWICVEDDSGARTWEKLGTQNLDLTGYVTDEELSAAVAQALLIAKESGEFKGDKGDPYTLTEDDKNTIVSGATEALKSEGGGVVLYTTQNLTEAQKAQARANIGATAGEEVEFADSVEDIPGDADKTAKYVLPDGYIYTWQEKVVSVVHNANNEDAKINLVPPTNATDADDSFVSKPGTFTSARIPFSSDWIVSGYDRTKTAVTIDGLEKIVPAYNSPVIIYYYKNDGTYLTAMLAKQLAVADSNSVEISLPLSVQLKNSNYTASTWGEVGYVRVMVGISQSGNISESDIANLTVSVHYYDYEETVSGWFSTGQQHSNDQATQQNSADIAALKERTDTLESGVEELRVAVESGVVSVPNRRTIYFVGDSITFGSGASNYGTLQAGWVNEVMNRCGYDTTTSKNLGVSGAGFVQLSPSSTPVTILDIVNANNFSAVDDIIVSAGINDWKNSSVAIADFWNNFKAVFVKLRADNKYARIYYQLPYNCKISAWTGSTYDTHWALDYKEGGSGNYCIQYTLATFRQMIVDKINTDEDLKTLNIRVIDYMPLTRNNISNITGDGLHPNDEGYKIIGKTIAQVLSLP